MSFLYPLVSDISSSLNSGSFLNQTDYSIFYSGSKQDFWFATSNEDAIELTIYNLDENIVSWESIQPIGQYISTSLSYYDETNSSVPYIHNDFVSNYPIYNNKNILVNPINDLLSFNIQSGSFILSYQFTRYLAGDPINTLSVKDISPSKTELKLIPTKVNSIEYEAFCLGKIKLLNVSQLYITSTQNCPYNSLYQQTKTTQLNQINLVKSLFFIINDGMFIEFLQNIYEDLIQYSSNNINIQTINRIQGIRTYFDNFLISNSFNIFTFDQIKYKFECFVNARLDILFKNFTNNQIGLAKQYLFNFFVKSFFDPIHNLLKLTYIDKFLSPLKNSLSYGQGKFLPIISTSYIDERVNIDDPFTLLIKLQNPLNDDISIKSNVWISNIGMVPIFFNCVVSLVNATKTFKISPANFNTNPSDISFSNSNIYYNNNDLTNISSVQNNITIGKNISKLNIDYTSFNNFIIFSSAQIRHNIFKNKMMSLSNISSSLSTLTTNYSSSGYSYPLFTSEQETLQNNQTCIVNSFDGFESYLYETGYYTYDTSIGTFRSQSFVSLMDNSASYFDKNNRDSLVNNTPEHIVVNNSNDDYLIFLSMVGHYFDNIYLYIQSLPSQKFVDNKNSLAKEMLQQMLQSFGWNINVALDDLNISDNYLNKKLGGNTTLSADERIKQIWNRILNTLPLLYKTKGTVECINILLSCYGIPSNTINIKEYGGSDYTNTDKTSYRVDESTFLLNFVGKGDFISVPFNSTIQTIEFKVQHNTNQNIINNVKIPLVTKYNQLSGSVDWTIGTYAVVGENLGIVYFEMENPNYNLLLSTPIPIFNGDIFNIMIRKNNPYSEFQYNSVSNLIPTKYDLWIQSKDNGRTIYSSSVSSILTINNNVQFSNQGTIYFGNYPNSSSFIGLLDKILIWDIPIDDHTYDVHCNNINAYSYTGSLTPYKDLYFRMNFDVPQDLSLSNPLFINNANQYYSSSIYGSAYNFGLQTYSASLDGCFYVSHSVYPFQFSKLDYKQTYTITSYGPNTFNNQKVQQVNMELASRLDANNRSTYTINEFVSPDSNKIGLFADPNDYKNRDIFKYLGDFGVTTLLGDPREMFNDEYYPLKLIRNSYNSSGNKKVLYNEMFALYRIFFDKSIFDTILQLIPARNNVSTGILIEPTVLERPKYKYKKICSTEGCSALSSSYSNPITSSNNIWIPTVSIKSNISLEKKPKSDILYANFNFSSDLFTSQLYTNIPFYIPTGPYKSTDLLYQEFLNIKYKLIYVNSGWIKINPSLGEIGNVESHPNWPIPAINYGPTGPGPIVAGFRFNGPLPGYYITGSGYYYLNQCYFYTQTNQNISQILNNLEKNVTAELDLSNISDINKIHQSDTNNDIFYDIKNPEELGIFCDNTGKVVEPIYSGSNIRYLIKNWNKDINFVNEGDYPNIQSQSIFLYSTQFWYQPLYEQLIYTSSYYINTPGNAFNSNFINGYSPIYSQTITGYTFKHDVGTFKNSPNGKVSNLYQTSSFQNSMYNFSIIRQDTNNYIETFKGYPRNHLNHKWIWLSNQDYPIITNTYFTQSVLTNNYIRYKKSSQNINTTIDPITGLENGTLPIQSVNVSNLNVIQSNNVIN